MTLDEHDVMNLIVNKPFENYMSSAEFSKDLTAGVTAAQIFV
jgi:hypothetical protein